MPITDLQAAAQTIADFLKVMTEKGGFRWKYRITAGEGARDPHGIEAREIYVELAGPDAPLLTARHGELLLALEHIGAQLLHLDGREHDLISFDALGFKAMRAEEIRFSAQTAAERVAKTGQPFSFPPMSSRERRLLHMALSEFPEVETASRGEGQERFLSVFPKGKSDMAVAAPVRPRAFGGRDGRDSRGRDRDRNRRGRDRR